MVPSRTEACRSDGPPSFSQSMRGLSWWISFLGTFSIWIFFLGIFSSLNNLSSPQTYLWFTQRPWLAYGDLAEGAGPLGLTQQIACAAWYVAKSSLNRSFVSRSHRWFQGWPLCKAAAGDYLRAPVLQRHDADHELVQELQLLLGLRRLHLLPHQPPSLYFSIVSSGDKDHAVKISGKLCPPYHSSGDNDHAILVSNVIVPVQVYTGLGFFLLCELGNFACHLLFRCWWLCDDWWLWDYVL